MTHAEVHGRLPKLVRTTRLSRSMSDLLQRLIAMCEKNAWLKVGGSDFEPEGFCCEHDYPYCLERYDDIDMLERFFAHGNWSIRAAVQHHDLIFVNQVNAGDEWWTVKIDGDNLVPFESITFRLLIERRRVPVSDPAHGTDPEQCKNSSIDAQSRFRS